MDNKSKFDNQVDEAAISINLSEEFIKESINLYGNKYDLCPKCTGEIHKLVTKNSN